MGTPARCCCGPATAPLLTYSYYSALLLTCNPPPANLQRPLLINHGPLMTCGTPLMTCGAPPADLWWPLPPPADLKPADLKHLLSHTSSDFTQRQTS